MEKQETNPLPSSNATSSSSAPPHLDTKEGIRRVPDHGGESTGKDTSDQEQQERLLRKKEEVYSSYLNLNLKEIEKRKSELEVKLYDTQNENQILRDSLRTGESREQDLEKNISELQEILSFIQNETQMFPDMMMNTRGHMRGAGGSNGDS